MSVVDFLKEVINGITGGISNGIVWSTFSLAFIGLFLFTLTALSEKDFQPIYIFIGTAITLSGFTMISGIFEKEKQKPKIIKNLFLFSIIFLVSALSFILFIGLFTLDMKPGDHQLVYQFWEASMSATYFGGIALFLFGLASLILSSS